MEATQDTFEAGCEDGGGNVGADKVGGLSWASPRISFSKDFVMGVSEISCSNGMGRLSPEKRKWEQASEEEISDEFEFRMSDSKRNGSQEAEEIMLSADELFFNGKLRPLARDDLCLLKAPEYKHLSLSRHLSFDTPRCSALVQPSSRSGPPSRSSSPPRPALPSTSTPASPRASSKYSSKIKEFFKPKKVSLHTFKEASCAQLTRDNSVTSTCRLPISPRSFWPFSRSNSAGESQTTTPPVPDLPPRSNSAGESKTTTSASHTSKRSDSTVAAKSCGTSCDSTGHSALQVHSNCLSIPMQASSLKKGGQVCNSSTPAPCIQPTSAVQEPCASDIRSRSSSSLPLSSLDHEVSRFQETVGAIEAAGSVGETVSAQLSCEQSSNQINVPDRGGTSLVQARAVLKNVSRVRGPGSHGRSPRRGVSSPARNCSRGSPGRRGLWNSPVAKGNPGKIMLRNLERCKAGTNIGVGRSQDLRTRSDGREGFPVTVRVSPVLNVAIYRGNSSSKTRLFSLKKLFSSRKAKPLEASVNNWRNGA